MNDSGKTPAVMREIVGEEAANQRVDNFLLRYCRGVPKSHIYRIVRSGEVRVNGKRVDPTRRLQPGDEVRIPPLRLPAEPDAPKPPPLRSFDIVFEDDHMIVLDKPAGLAVHGGSGVSHGVIELLRHGRPHAKMLELAHRLDRETSGLLMVAKKRSALTALHSMLRDGQVRKTYVALVKGRWRDPLRTIRLPLRKYLTEEGERRVAVQPDGKPAVSHVRLLRRWENFSLVGVELETGRTHQIRVHLTHAGHPLCGDDKYGDFALNRTLQKLGLKRMFLHAASLELAHPATGAPLRFDSPLPADLRGFLDALERNETADHGAPL